jgi:homoserine kinase type II
VGTFTQLAAAEMQALARTFGLGDVLACRPIAAGTINSNFDLVTARGRFFLRINEGKSEGDVAWEATLVTLLAQRGVPTPPPLLAKGGYPYAAVPKMEPAGLAPAGGIDKYASVFAWRDGHHLGERDVTTDRAHTFGVALAQLHRAGLELPEGFRRTSIYDHAHLVARYHGFSRSDDPELQTAIAILGEELTTAERAAPVRRMATYGLIHGDLFRDNVLWNDDKLTAILDFEQASGGSLAYDLAVCINDWCWDGAPRLDLAAALLAGYQSVRPLADADRAALPIELRAAAARFTITRITDVYLAKVDNPEKDFRAFLARCLAWKGPALGQLTSTV